jgi:hypothetical protein
MSTPPGWEPRTGPTRGDPARRAPRGPGGLARDDANPRRQGERGGTSAGGRGWEAGPGFTPGRTSGPRDGGPAGPGGPQGPRGQRRPFPNADGSDRRSPRPDDFGGRPRLPGAGRAVDRGGPTGDQVGFDGYRSGGPARWLGRMPTWTSILLLFAGTVVGVIVTLVAGQEPGGLLGFFIIVGTIAAALCIRPGKVYLLFPVPALAFFLAAIVTGKVHDAKLGSSTAGLGAGFTQWVAGIFFPAVIATIIVVLIGGGRWLLGRQLISGQSPLSAGRPAPGKPRPAPRDRRPGTDSWANDNPPSARTSQTGPAPRQDTGPRPGSVPAGARPPRPPRDPRGTRDPWGDPRLPGGRTQPPTGNPRPRPSGQSQPQPRAPRPSWSPNPNPAPQRHPRRQPPEGWTQRLRQAPLRFQPHGNAVEDLGWLATP